MGANGNSQKVSSALSESPAVPLSHHPPKGHRQMQACRKPTNPPAFHKQPSCPQLTARSHPDNSMLWVVSEHPSSRRAELGSDGQELFFTQALSALYSPSSFPTWRSSEASHPHSAMKAAFHRDAAASQHGPTGAQDLQLITLASKWALLKRSQGFC